MAESILTSINLAGGSFNVFYDTVLDVITGNSSRSYDCPAGWKAAVVISYSRHIDNFNNDSVLMNPIPIFNTGKSVTYYGIFINTNYELERYVCASVVNVTDTQFRFQYSGSINYSGTIIFVS